MSDQKTHGDEGKEPNNVGTPPAVATPAVDAENRDPKNQANIKQLVNTMNRAERGMLCWSRVVGVFTAILAIVGAFQFYAFTESERAFLVITNIGFINGEPVATPEGLDPFMIIKNVGKHVANITVLNVFATIGIVKKDLADEPIYDDSQSIKNLPSPPIAPDTSLTIPMRVRNITPPAPMTLEQEINGILSGDIPIRIFGFIEYDIGYPSWNPGRSAFCAEYVPTAKRRIGPVFQPCNNRKYTYTR